MSYKKVLEVAQKFADAQNDNQKFQQQRERLGRFFDAFLKDFSTAVNTIEGDFHTLKLKGFDHDTLKIMYKLLQNLTEYRKYFYKKDQELNTNDVYPKINKIVNYILERNNLAVIDNLDFLSQHFMKANQVSFISDKMMVQPKLNGLKLLKKMAMNAKEYMEKNPLLASPGSVSSPALPRNQFSDEVKAGPADATNPGVPVRKNPQAAE